MESYHKYALFKIPDLGCIQCGSNMSISLACLASESRPFGNLKCSLQPSAEALLAQPVPESSLHPLSI